MDDEMGAAYSAHGVMINMCKHLVGKPEVKKPRSRWEDNIKVYFMEIRVGDVDWVHLAQDRDGGGLLWAW
jgi:hypothetical protein